MESLIRPRCVEKDIGFDADVAGVPGVRVTGDKLRLKQVLINLLGSAVKFTASIGHIGLLAEWLG